MSQHSDPASRLGRLNLDGNGTSREGHTMVVTTRGQARRDDGRRTSSRAPSRPARRGQRESLAPSRVQPQRASAVNRHRVTAGDSEEDSDEDDDGDDDDEDCSEDDQPNPPPVNVSPDYCRMVIRAMFAAFDPSRMSPPEFNVHDPRVLTPESQAYRALVDAVAGSVRTIPDLQAISNVCSLTGETWGNRVYAILRSRVEDHINKFTDGNTAEADAARLLDEFQRIYRSVYTIMRETPYRAMLERYKQDSITLLCFILDYIIAMNYDVRTSQVAQHYAGGGGQYEFNLYMRFSSEQCRWQPFLDVLESLSSDPTQPKFRQMLLSQRAFGYLRSAYEKLHQRQTAGNLSHSANDLFRRMHLFAQNLSSESLDAPQGAEAK